MRMVGVGRHLEEPSSTNVVSLETARPPIEQIPRSHTSLNVAFFRPLHLRLELRVLVTSLIIVHRTIRDGLISNTIEFHERLLAGRVKFVLRYGSGAFRVPRRRFLRLWRASPEAVAI